MNKGCDSSLEKLAVSQLLCHYEASFFFTIIHISLSIHIDCGHVQASPPGFKCLIGFMRNNEQSNKIAQVIWFVDPNDKNKSGV